MKKECIEMEYKARFLKYSKMTTSEQIACKGEIVDLFREFWTGKSPSIELFATCLNEIVVFPELLYIMVIGKPGAEI